jgi:hypothetical protein
MRLRIATLLIVLAPLLTTACPSPGTTPISPPDAAPDLAPDLAPDGPPDQAPDVAPAAYFPCDVEAVLKAKCHTCHTSPTRMGAPFPLLQYAATQMSYSGDVVWRLMKTAIEIDFMPEASSPTGPLTPAEKTTMLTWLGASAPPAAQACPAP